MSASRTANLVLAGALGLGSLVGLAAPALADTPPAGDEMVLVLGEGGGIEGPGEIAQPEPAPQPPEDKAPVPQPDPEPQPQPFPGPGEIAQPQGHGDPEPGDLPVDGPDDGPVVNPDIPEGPEDIKDDAGCQATHGCEPEVPGDLTDRPDDEDDCHPFAASCDLTDREPSDEEPEVLGGGETRGALPRTGAGLAALAGAGGALTGIGAALRKLARRR